MPQSADILGVNSKDETFPAAVDGGCLRRIWKGDYCFARDEDDISMVKAIESAGFTSVYRGERKVKWESKKGLLTVQPAHCVTLHRTERE